MEPRYLIDKNMKKLIYLLLTMPLLFTSCGNDEVAVGEETVQVSFCAEIPHTIGTRASSELSVDRVWCAVFENGEEISALREEITIVEGQSIVFAPRLIKDRTYNIVFWASKAGSYNVDDMTAITRNSDVAEKDYDAFTGTTQITVTGNVSDEITLQRPIAQLNMGVTEEDWNGVASTSTFNMTPTTIQITMSGKSTFNALQGSATGSDETITYNLGVSGTNLSVGENTYKSIAMCYILSESTKETKNITYSIYDQSGSAIRENVGIDYVPLQRNYKTNIVGGLLTGTVSYTIGFDEEFSADNEHGIEIE